MTFSACLNVAFEARDEEDAVEIMVMLKQLVAEKFTYKTEIDIDDVEEL
jgi:hypothetical protein